MANILIKNKSQEMKVVTNYGHLLSLTDFSFKKWYLDITNQNNLIVSSPKDIDNLELLSLSNHSLAERICAFRKEPEKVAELEAWFFQEYKPSEIDYVEDVIDMFFKNKYVFEETRKNSI